MQEQKTVDKINTSETNDILKVLVQAVSDAYNINKNNDEESSKSEINNFLNSIEKKVTKFFRDNVDRRKELRQKTLIEDMLIMYKIKGSGLI